MALDPVTGGYWEVARRRRASSPSAAPRSSDLPPARTWATRSSASPAPRGQGYWLVTGNGAVFSYGSAAFHGSVAALALNAPVGGCRVDPATGGYWLFSVDGGIFAFGRPFLGAG